MDEKSSDREREIDRSRSILSVDKKGNERDRRIYMKELYCESSGKLL